MRIFWGEKSVRYKYPENMGKIEREMLTNAVRVSARRAAMSSRVSYVGFDVREDAFVTVDMS